MKLTAKQLKELAEAGLVDLEQDDKEFAEKEAEKELEQEILYKNGKKYLKLDFIFNPLDFGREYTEDEYNTIMKLNEKTIRAEHMGLNKSGIHFEEKKGLKDIADDCKASLVKYGDMAEVTAYFNRSDGNGLKNIKRLPGNRFLRKDTGEIFEGKKNQQRTESVQNLNKSIQMIKKLILNNFQDDVGQFITLTYSYAMKDYDKAKMDIEPVFDVFRYRKLDYLWVIEPKDSGSWHYHILVKPKGNTNFELTEKHLKKAWSYGSIHIEPIEQIEGLALYLGHSTVDDKGYDSVCDDEQGIFMLCTNKKYTKRRRAYYPSGARIYGKSKGIKKPTKENMSYGEAIKAVDGYKEIDSCCKVVRKGTTVISNVVNIWNVQTFKQK